MMITLVPDSVLADFFFEIGYFSERNSNTQFFLANSAQKVSYLSLKCAAPFFFQTNSAIFFFFLAKESALMQSQAGKITSSDTTVISLTQIINSSYVKMI
jgi:hypothetical protein